MTCGVGQLKRQMLLLAVWGGRRWPLVHPLCRMRQGPKRFQHYGQSWLSFRGSGGRLPTAKHTTIGSSSAADSGDALWASTNLNHIPTPTRFSGQG